MESQQNNLQQLQGEQDSTLQAINTNVNTATNDLEAKVNTVATGLATLQENLSITQDNLSEFKDGLTKVDNFRKIINYSLFFLLMIVIALGVTFYIKGGNFNIKLPCR